MVRLSRLYNHVEKLVQPWFYGKSCMVWSMVLWFRCERFDMIDQVTKNRHFSVWSPHDHFE